MLTPFSPNVRSLNAILLVTIGLLSGQLTGYAQISKLSDVTATDVHRFYFGAGIQVNGHPVGGALSLAYEHPSNWGVVLTHDYVTQPGFKPADYSPGLSISLFGTRNRGPFDDYFITSLSLLRRFPLGNLPSKHFIGVAVGPSLVARQKIRYTPRINPCFLCSNYTVDRQSESFTGLNLRVFHSVASTSFMGFEYGLAANVNAAESNFGGYIQLLLGKLARRRK